MISAMEPRSMPSTDDDRPGVLAFPPLIYAAGLIAGFLLQALLPLHLGWGIGGRLLGGLLLALALAIVLWAERTMSRAGTNVNPMKPAKALVTEGPFRYSRNPMYLALTTLYVGISLLFATFAPLIFLPLVLAVMHFGVILREERYLELKFGQEYRRYKARVRRWL